MHFDATIFGYSIGYSSNNPDKLLQDIQTLRPTIFGSFPVFYSKIVDKINQEVAKRGKLLQTIFDSAVQTKIFNYLKEGTIHHTFYDAIIFRIARNMLGGRIRWMVSGGAPMKPEVKHMLTAIFSAPVFECLGMTESAGCLTSTSYWDRQGGHQGGVLPCCRMQLRDCADLNASTNSSPPTGEIFLKGNSVFKGYFKNPELTATVLDKDGWLRVGDVASLNKDGSIKLIGRVFEMSKLQNGQLISPVKLEEVYQNTPIIKQICVDINSNYNFLGAVVYLDQEKVKQFALVNDLKLDFTDLLSSSEVESAVIKQLEQTAENNNLSHIEHVKVVVISKEAFSVENGLLTGTMKL